MSELNKSKNDLRDSEQVLPDPDLLRTALTNSADTEEVLRQLDGMTVQVKRHLEDQGSRINQLDREVHQALNHSEETVEKKEKRPILSRIFGGRDPSKLEKNVTTEGVPSSEDKVAKPVTKNFIKVQRILSGPDNPVREQLIQYLREGDIEKFNKIRLSGCIDFRGIDLSGLDLKGVDLRHVDLSRANLQRCNLEGAMLQHSILDRADLSKTILKGAKLYKVSACYADFRGIVEASGAELQGAILRSADLSDGNFSGADFTDAIMITATCTGACFKGPNTHMERACLAGAVLSGATFEGANLIQARLFQANGEDVDFAGANLTSAEAVQSHFTSSGKKSVESGKTLKTSFSGAWVKGFIHNGAIAVDLLHDSISDRTPPEGMFSQARDVDPGRILINGVPGTDKVLYDAALLELNELVGMEDAKEQVLKLTHFVEASQARQRFGLPPYKIWLHKVLLGPPGVGKTTLARIMAQLEHALALRKKGHLVETDKSGLIAGYAGQTLGKTSEVIDEAMDGTLLIDEAYALGQSKDDAYAMDATAVIVKRMWDDRERLTVTFAGYEEETEAFVNSNTGMRSRIGMWIRLKPFSNSELVEIFKLNLDKQLSKYDAKLLGAVSVLLELTSQREKRRFGNARTVEKIVNDLNFNHSGRLKQQDLMEVERAHKVPPLIEDLPFKEVAGIEYSDLPELAQFSWINSEGHEIGIDQISLDDPFPKLSNESNKIIEAIVQSTSQ